MKTNFDVRRLAELARMTITDEEEALFGQQLSSVLNFVDQLQEVDTTGVPETAQVTGLTDVFQSVESEVIDDQGRLVQRATYLAATPQQVDGFIKIPAIFESENS